MKYGKKDKNPRSIRVSVALLLGVLTVTVGALLATLSLVTQQVRELSSLPEADKREPGTVYFLKGSDAGGDAWESRFARLTVVTEGEVRLTEGDLNQWSQSELSFDKRPQPDAETAQGQQAAEPGAAQKLLGLVAGLVPDFKPVVSVPNFRVADGMVQASVSVSCSKIMSGKKFLYQVRGVFETDEAGAVKFVVREGHLGRAPIGYVPYMNQWVTAAIADYFDDYPAYERVAEPWDRVREVRIEGDELVVKLGPKRGV